MVKFLLRLIEGILYVIGWFVLVGIILFVGGIIVFLFITTPLASWIKSPEEKAFHRTLEESSGTLSLPLKKLTSFEWKAVCQWGDYGSIGDKNMPLQVLGLDTKQADKMVYAEEGKTTLIFKTPKGFIPVYLDSYSGWKNMLFKDEGEKDCYTFEEDVKFR